MSKIIGEHSGYPIYESTPEEVEAKVREMFGELPTHGMTLEIERTEPDAEGKWLLYVRISQGPHRGTGWVASWNLTNTLSDHADWAHGRCGTPGAISTSGPSTRRTLARIW